MNAARILRIVPGEAPDVLYQGAYTTGIDVFGEDVYFGTTGGGEVLWSGIVIPLDGSAPTELMNAASGPLALPVAADEHGAFTADNYSGDLYRL